MSSARAELGTRIREARTALGPHAARGRIALARELAQAGLPAGGEINYFQAPLTSRVTQLAVIDALFVSLALKHKNKTAGRLQQSAEELLKRRLR